MRIGIGCDHVGFAQKAPFAEALEQDGHALLDLGTFSPDPVDYPDVARAVANAVRKGFVEMGILIAESGVGAAIAADKVKGIRAAFCHDSNTARQSRAEDDANFLCLDAGVTDPRTAIEIAREWLRTPFAGDERRVRLLAKVMELEKEPAPPPKARPAAKAPAPDPEIEPQAVEEASPPPAAPSPVEILITSLADEKLRVMAARIYAFLISLFAGAESALDSSGKSFTLTVKGEHAATVYIDKASLRLEAGPDRIPSGKIADLAALERVMTLPSIVEALQAVKQS